MRSRLAAWLGLNNTASGQATAPKPRWLILRRLLGAAIILLALYYLGRISVNTMRQVDWRSFRLRPGPLLASLGVNVICIGLGAIVWGLVLRSLGYSLRWDKCLDIQTTSNLAKYLPGYAWQLVGKAYLTRREQVPSVVIGLALVLELAGLCLTGIWVALWAIPAGAGIPGVPTAWLPRTWAGNFPLAVRVALLILLALLSLTLPYLFRILARVGAIRQHLPDLKLQPVVYWAALAVFVLAWVLLGQAFDWLLPVIGHSSAGSGALATYTLTLSFIIGLLTLFVPAGIGVREGMMVYLLSSQVIGGLAVAVAILSRLVLIASELLAFGLSRLLIHVKLRSQLPRSRQK